MSDTFRKVYRSLNESNSLLIVALKEAYAAVEDILNKVDSRAMSIAKTDLESSSMWATKAIVLEDENNDGKPI